MCSALQILDANVPCARAATPRGRRAPGSPPCEAAISAMSSELRPRRSAPPLAIKRQGLERLRRRAPEGDLVQRIADREAELAVR